VLCGRKVQERRGRVAVASGDRRWKKWQLGVEAWERKGTDKVGLEVVVAMVVELLLPFPLYMISRRRD